MLAPGKLPLFSPPADLPVTALLPELRAALAAAPQVLLHAPPGAGKTTVVPPALLGETWLAGGAMLMLEPRRLAARAAAARIAELLGEKAGATAGYRTRLDRCVSAATRIELVTEGILARRLQRDPGLDGVGLVIFDEFHERHLQTDLALALGLDTQRQLRPDLRILIMSATLAATRLQALLPRATTVACTGRQFPVAIKYLPETPDGDPAVYTAAAVRRALAETSGNILAFLPGAGEIHRAGEILAETSIEIVSLYGDLPRERQDDALRPGASGQRRVVLATPLAETSVTVAGIGAVVDCGWQRQPRYDAARDLTRLETVRVSRANAEQRAGRAGRLGPGTCYRLWSEGLHHALMEFPVPEILQADLTPLALELAAWGVSDPTTLTWPDPPPAGPYAKARATLQALGALDATGKITAAGRALATLPVHPRLGVMLLHGAELGRGALAADIAALLSERDIIRGRAHDNPDFTARLAALHAFRRGRPGRDTAGAPAACAADRGGAFRVDKIAQQFRTLLKTSNKVSGTEADIGFLLALAYPDRVARRREKGGDLFLLASGVGARLLRGDVLRHADWLAVAELEAGRGDNVIRLAAALTEEDLRNRLPQLLNDEEVIGWDETAGAVSAVRRELCGAIVLREGALARPDPELLRAAMLDGIRRAGLACLPWTDDCRDWQQRVLSLRTWFPADAWPDVSEETLLATLADWLGPCLTGKTRLAHLAGLDLFATLAGLLDRRQRQQLDRLAPTHVTVPTGSHLRLQYADGQPPVLAVRLQEMFGCTDTPRVAGGKIKVLLHLLSPARRPVQVTDNLAGFWVGSYAQVRKELRGRYPKHVWPDNPLTATPTRRAKPQPDKQ